MPGNGHCRDRFPDSASRCEPVAVRTRDSCFVRVDSEALSGGDSTSLPAQAMLKHCSGLAYKASRPRSNLPAASAGAGGRRIFFHRTVTKPRLDGSEERHAVIDSLTPPPSLRGSGRAARNRFSRLRTSPPPYTVRMPRRGGPEALQSNVR